MSDYEAELNCCKRVRELEAVLAAERSDGTTGKLRATIKQWKYKVQTARAERDTALKRISELEEKLETCMWMGKDVVNSRNEYAAERDRYREALLLVASTGDWQRTQDIANEALEEK